MKNKTAVPALFLSALMLLSLAGCAGKSSGAGAGSGSAAASGAASGTASSSAASGGDAAAAGADWLPANTPCAPMETKPDAKLAQVIAAYYQIPQEDLADNSYAYQYVDLNGDGTQEILAVTAGSYTSGTGGDSMLWILPNADWAVSQAFTLVRTPILVTDALTNGAKQLIVQRSGGGAPTEVVALSCSDGQYANVGDGTALSSLDGVAGTALFCTPFSSGAEGWFPLSAK